MPVLTDLASAVVRSTVTTLYGKTVGRPTLFMSDGANVGYVVDVNIGELDPTGEINQYFKQKEDGTLDTATGGPNKGTTPGSDLIGLPGQPPEDWMLDDTLPGHVDTTLHNVPLSRNNADLIYADTDAPVVVTRSGPLGAWEVTGFSIQQPGTHMLYPVDLGDMTLGTVIDLSVTSRLLTLAELGEMAPFGTLMFGVSAVYKGNILLRFA